MSYNDIPETTKQAVINFFKTENNNTIPVIAKNFNLGEHIINRIINEYLDKPKQIKTSHLQ